MEIRTEKFCLRNALLLILLGLHLPLGAQLLPTSMVDPDATKATQSLYENLRALAPEKTLFGHQDAFAYGVEWKHWHRRRSDVQDVCGQHPAVFGWDVSKLGQRPYNIDTVDFRAMQGWIRQAYRMGGINTISWHLDNFLGGDSWTTGTPTVAAILPGGTHHEQYRAKLDLFADFLRELKVGFPVQRPVPIIFRPFHEHTGNWFWWGKPHATAEQYKALWRFTVSYLRDEQQIHQLLYCYSPDVVKNEEEYLEYYPGDEYVDILGLDDYHDVGRWGRAKQLTKRLSMLVQLAEERGKVAALTETGYEAVPERKWWTDTLLRHLEASPEARRIAWVLLWRNARKDHHYGPYPGHPSAENFREFAGSENMLFLDELPNMYRR
ncbi:glycosyl hydrolase [Lewinella sp. W8]|uniref:glycoside hydrolase family 26 protein n=1 Tax=Lewinella sp. W8 TaxID=2528208 RepID=UPI001C12C2BF